MATELRELSGLPKLIQKQFGEHQEKHNGNDEEKAELLLTMSQWKELLATNKKAFSLFKHRRQPRLGSSHQLVRK